MYREVATFAIGLNNCIGLIASGKKKLHGDKSFSISGFTKNNLKITIFRCILYYFTVLCTAMSTCIWGEHKYSGQIVCWEMIFKGLFRPVNIFDMFFDYKLLLESWDSFRKSWLVTPPLAHITAVWLVRAICGLHQKSILWVIPIYLYVARMSLIYVRSINWCRLMWWVFIQWK